MKTLLEVSRALRERQKALRVSQETLRANAGLSRQTLTRVLQGDQDFKLSTLLAVADRLGLEMVLLPREAVLGVQGAATEPVVATAVEEALARLRGERP
jgi:transcriptional regulator with XRE-family HTH domain